MARIAHNLTLLAVSLALNGCIAPTEPLPVHTTIREVSLSAEEQKLWPTTPTVAGGSVVTIRGIAPFGCGQPAVSATRRGSAVSVQVTSINADRPCIAIIPSWRPYEAQLNGLSGGEYLVSVRSVGFEGEAQWTLNVTSIGQ